MSIAHILNIRDQFFCKLVIGKGIPILVAAPGTGMDLIDIDGLAVMRLRFFMAEPCGVMPLEPGNIIIFAGISRSSLKMERIGINLKNVFPLRCCYTELVRIILLELKRQEAFPYSTVTDFLHQVCTRLPTIEIPNDRDHRSIRRPDTADHARFSVPFNPMYTQEFICFIVCTLMK